MSISKDMSLVASLVLVCAAGCAMQQAQVEQQLQNPGPINCATAPGDLRVLQSEKATALQQLAGGVSAITPAGIVLGAATGLEGTKVQVATGEYNQMIDKRIAEIRRACGL